MAVAMAELHAVVETFQLWKNAEYIDIARGYDKADDDLFAAIEAVADYLPELLALACAEYPKVWHA